MNNAPLAALRRATLAAALGFATLAQAQTAATAPAAPLASSPAKKELVQKLLALQQPAMEGLARSLVEQPAGAIMQQAGRALQQVPADRREAAGKSIESDVRKYVDETTPLVRDRAVKLAPSTLGTALDEKFTEDELRALVAWYDSPVRRKYDQVAPDLQKNFVEKLVAESRPSVEPKIQALDAKVRATLGVPAEGAANNAAPRAPTRKK